MCCRLSDIILSCVIKTYINIVSSPINYLNVFRVISNVQYFFLKNWKVEQLLLWFSFRVGIVITTEN